MNKQEVINQVNSLKVYKSSRTNHLVNKNKVLFFINQIDEPKKPTIPKFVAEWFSKNPIEGWWRKISQWEQKVTFDDMEVYKWYSNYNEIKFIQAWIAYPNVEVEKEKLYAVEIPNPNCSGSDCKIILKRNGENLIELCVFVKPDFKEDKYQLTESEIKKDFEWAWQFAQEVE